MLITSQAPCRISFAGGGTDVDPYAKRYGGKVLNAAISLYTRVTLKPHPGRPILLEALGEKRLLLDFRKPLNYGKDPKFDLVRAVMNHFRRDLPCGFKLNITIDGDSLMGLGSSGSAAVALIACFAAWLGKKMSQHDIASLAYELETKDLAWPGGRQDQWASALGGINVMTFGPKNRNTTTPLALPKAALTALKNHLLIAYVGGYRHSKEQQKILIKKMRSAKTKASLDKIKLDVDAAKAAILSNDWQKLGGILSRGWRSKKAANAIVSNEWIDRLHDIVTKQGAYGGKISGSGGAGHMMFLIPPSKKRATIKKLNAEGATLIPFDFDFKGVRTKVSR